LRFVGWACAVLALFYFDGVQRWVYFTMMALLGGTATWAGLWREDIHLDVIHRRYSRRRGFWPVVETLEGSFDQIAGVYLATVTCMSGSRINRVYTVWVVGLALPGEKEGLTILSFDDQSEALGRLKALSSKLRVPVINSPTGWDKPPPRTSSEGH
jgi:hypothetical protein